MKPVKAHETEISGLSQLMDGQQRIETLLLVFCVRESRCNTDSGNADFAIGIGVSLDKSIKKSP